MIESAAGDFAEVRDKLEATHSALWAVPYSQGSGVDATRGLMDRLQRIETGLLKVERKVAWQLAVVLERA